MVIRAFKSTFVHFKNLDISLYNHFQKVGLGFACIQVECFEELHSLKRSRDFFGRFYNFTSFYCTNPLLILGKETKQECIETKKQV